MGIMEDVKKLLTDAQIIDVWGNANFGRISKRKVIGNALLKFSTDNGTGHTIQMICYELGLIDRNKNLTTFGKRYMFAYFSNDYQYKI